MRTTSSIRPMLFAACALMICAGAANAQISLSNYGSGKLTTTYLGNDEYFVTGITGTFNGAPLSLLPTTDPIPNPTTCPGMPQFYQANPYLVDDIIYYPGFPGATSSCQTSGLLLDEGGLGVQAGNTAINLLSLNTDDFIQTGYYFFLPNNDFDSVSFTVSPTGSDGTFSFIISGSVPEPATLALLAAGLAGIGIALTQRRRKRR